MYSQLTAGERYQIYAFLKAGYSQTAIANELGRNKSTISREISRNKGGRGYRPKQAHELAMHRRYRPKGPSKLTSDLWHEIEKHINEQWSPEQISGWRKDKGLVTVSHEWIYQQIFEEKRNGGQLYQNLRQSHKKRRKRYGTNSRRGLIPNRTFIDQRPAVVAAKERIGDWELDTIIGKGHKMGLVSTVERKSIKLRLGKVQTKSSQEVSAKTITLLEPIKDYVHTITLDNGKEFSSHQQISETLDADIYFCHPYHAWERGLNENINGLIRQYFPKATDFSKITAEEVAFVEERLNNRPRKSLGYKTPNEVFAQCSIQAVETDGQWTSPGIKSTTKADLSTALG